jgi:hypothetical protein
MFKNIAKGIVFPYFEVVRALRVGNIIPNTLSSQLLLNAWDFKQTWFKEWYDPFSFEGITILRVSFFVCVLSNAMDLLYLINVYKSLRQ